jgi:hypothetical protein
MFCGLLRVEIVSLLAHDLLLLLRWLNSLIEMRRLQYPPAITEKAKPPTYTRYFFTRGHLLPL